jgi:hypothetical protein
MKLNTNVSSDVPVLFITFNRPNETRLAFQAIRDVKPKRLFVACDAPRNGNQSDIDRVAAVRSLVHDVDWNCECEYLFQDNNLGCGKGPATAIDWFFTKVEAGIILEDDCIATPSFFLFCAEMLRRYVDDPKIMSIAGTNVTVGVSYETDYIFSNFPIMWGWATWRRAWKLYDFRMDQWPKTRGEQSIAKESCDNWKRHPVYKEFFDRTYESVQSGKETVWDHQWIFCNWINDGLTVTSTKNLVRNIGFGADATHTTIDDLGRSNLNTYTSLPPYKGPNTIRAHDKTDSYISKYWFTATWLYYAKILILRVKIFNKIWSWIKYFRNWSY